MPVSDTAAPRRFVFLDLLRLLAIFQMVQGHTLDAVLDGSLRVGPVHAAWTSLRGLTSVAFLFVAGFSGALVLFGDYGRQRTDAERVRARVRRAAGLVALGYALHLPLAVLFGARPTEALRQWALVDVLHCIGVSLLSLELAVRACPSPRALLGVAAVATVLGFAGAPPAWRLAGQLPPVLAGYFGPVQGALFPLWPWGGHLWFGVLAGGLIRSRRLGVLPALAGGAATFGGLAWLADWLGLGVPTGQHLGRLAWVLAVAAALAVLARDLPRLPAAAQRISTSSLRIYVAHVLVVYAGGVGLSTRPGATLSPTAALAVTALIVAGSAALAFVPGPERWVVARVPRTG